MRNRSIWIGLMLVLALAWTTNAYADVGAAWTDFWGGVGGFIYNALPWNWGNWAGK
ncbi:MAG TPA: hypothetical protein VD883_00365 [Candidatus Omnitrophota bacterium]|nr:hypothetical protein [Candidatus Omnitrophota bacterium]